MDDLLKDIAKHGHYVQTKETDENLLTGDNADRADYLVDPEKQAALDEYATDNYDPEATSGKA